MAKRIRIFTNPAHDKPDKRRKDRSSLAFKDRDQIIAGASSLGVKVPFGITKVNRKERRAARFKCETLPWQQHQQGKTAIGRKGKGYRHTTDDRSPPDITCPAKQARLCYKRYSKKVGRGVPGSVKNAVPKSPYPKPKAKD